MQSLLDVHFPSLVLFFVVAVVAFRCPHRSAPSLRLSRDSMRDDFAVLTYLLHLVPAITYVFDRELDDFISKSKVKNPCDRSSG